MNRIFFLSNFGSTYHELSHIGGFGTEISKKKEPAMLLSQNGEQHWRPLHLLEQIPTYQHNLQFLNKELPEGRLQP
jgi:hypothetical protein